MGTTSLVGKNAKVAIGTAKVLGIGTWSLSGVVREKIDDSEFGDERKKFVFGMIDGGTISFSGNAKIVDTTGQVALHEAYDANTELTTLRLYVDNTSYYEPCQTTGYLHPANTTGNNTILSYVNITAANVSTDKTALAQVDFQGDVSGSMVLV